MTLADKIDAYQKRMREIGRMTPEEAAAAKREVFRTDPFVGGAHRAGATDDQLILLLVEEMRLSRAAAEALAESNVRDIVLPASQAEA